MQRSIRISVMVVAALGVLFLGGRFGRRESLHPRELLAPAHASADSGIPGRPLALRAVLPELRSPVANWREWTPEQITVTLPGDISVRFERRETKRGTDACGQQYTVWIGGVGRAISSESRGWSLVGVGTAQGWIALASLPSAIYLIQVRGDLVGVSEQAESGTCGFAGHAAGARRVSAVASGAADPRALGSRPSLAPQLMFAPQTPQVFCQAIAVSADDTRDRSDSVPVHSVDVLVFYDRTAEQAAMAGLVGSSGPTNDGAAQPPVALADVPRFMNAYLRACLESGNVILQDSGIQNLRWDLIGAFRAPDYPSSGSIVDDLDRLVGTEAEPGFTANPKAAALGADQVLLITGSRIDHAGVAMGLGHHCVATLESGYTTLAHELIHTFGVGHDRATDQVPDDEPGYHFGYRFEYVYASALEGATEPRVESIGDLMSYADHRLHYLASPEVWLTGTSLVNASDWTDARQYPLGIAAGQPRSADAARWLRETAEAMSTFRSRSTSPAPPTWRSLPPSQIAIARGQTFTLIASADGATDYRWAQIADEHGSLPVPDPFSSNNVITFVGGLTLAGTFVVTASNANGSIQSDPIVVSVHEPEAEPPRIITAPADSTFVSGGVLMLSVDAAHATSYQWYHNGSKVGGSSHVYRRSVVMPEDAGWYTVEVSNAFGSVTSEPAAVSVTTVTGPLPTLLSAPPAAVVLDEQTSPAVLQAGVANAVGFQWFRDGDPCTGERDGLQYVLPAGQTPQRSGLYVLKAANAAGSMLTAPTIVGIRTSKRVIGTGAVLSTDIRHPNGHRFDQIALGGTSAGTLAAFEAFTARPGVVVRSSYLDEDGDIVQIEFSGAGTVSLVLENASGPEEPAKYWQPGGYYMKGRAHVVVVDADETSNLTVFTVGRATAYDPSGCYDISQPISEDNDPANNGNPLFLDPVTTTYDGVADLSYVAISSRNGRFGGLRAGNVRFSSDRGLTGIYAPDAHFNGPVVVGDIHADGLAEPTLRLGSATDVRIAGGDLSQLNGRPVDVSGFTELRFTEGMDSGGFLTPAQDNSGRLVQEGVDVTDAIVDSPVPLPEAE